MIRHCHQSRSDFVLTFLLAFEPTSLAFRLPLCLLLFVLLPRAAAQEPPYFVTYSSALEEPGNLEISLKNTQASPPNGNRVPRAARWNSSTA